MKIDEAVLRAKPDALSLEEKAALLTGADLPGRLRVGRSIADLPLTTEVLR